MKSLALVPIVLTAAATAHAGGGSTLKAHLECAQEGGQPLATKAKVALDKDVGCAVVIDGGAVPADAKVAIDGKVVTPIGAVKGRSHDAASTDGKHYIADAFVSGNSFLPCAGLQLDASIAQGSKDLWTGQLVLGATCAAPKATTANLTCTGDSAHNGYVSFPGNGDKVADELPEGLTCTINASKDDDVAHFGVLVVHGASMLAQLTVLQPPQQGAPKKISFAQFTAGQIPKCKPFTVDAVVLDKGGAPVWQKSLTVSQTCKSSK